MKGAGSVFIQREETNRVINQLEVKYIHNGKWKQKESTYIFYSEAYIQNCIVRLHHVSHAGSFFSKALL